VSNHVIGFPAVSFALMLKLCEQVRYLGLMSYGLPLHIILIRERTVCNFRVQTYNVHMYPGIRGGVVVEALRYKMEGRGFDSRWCHCIFSLT
jgi:hypothetical protein